MRSPITRGVRRLVRSTQTMVSQIVVSVAAAVCVAFITNAYLSDGAKPDLAAAEQPAAMEQTAVAPAPIPRQPKAASVAATTLPPLDVEVIADVPAGAGPAQEIFPGVPAGMSSEALEQSVAAQEEIEVKKERRRFLGIPLPFASTAGDLADSAARAGAGLVDLVSGG
jgi:DsbC/DsbD-like thiol-disulfide interchange protein